MFPRGLPEYIGRNVPPIGYTGIFVDAAGGNARRGLGRHADKFRGFWPFDTWEWFHFRGHTFPLAVWEEFENRIVKALGLVSRVMART